MKTFLLVLLAIIIAVAAFIYTDPQLNKDVSNMFHRIFLDTTGVDSRSTTVYKWKDKNGVFQYTQELPPEGTPYEEIEARTDVNVVPLPEKLKK